MKQLRPKDEISVVTLHQIQTDIHPGRRNDPRCCRQVPRSVPSCARNTQQGPPVRSREGQRAEESTKVIRRMMDRIHGEDEVTTSNDMCSATTCTSNTEVARSSTAGITSYLTSLRCERRQSLLGGFRGSSFMPVYPLSPVWTERVYAQLHIS